MKNRIKSVVLVASLNILLLAAIPVFGSNGMNMIAYDARSAGLAGADVALDSDCTGCNPATLGGEGRRVFSAGVALVHPPVNFKNGFLGPNDVTSDGNIYTAPYLEYAQRLKDSPWTLGLTLRAQGGMGVEYDDVRTFAGNQDVLYTDLPIARVMPTAAYRFSDRLKLGAALVAGFVQMESKLYPNTWSPGPDGMPATPDDFAGTALEDASGTGYALRLGLHWQATDVLDIGMTWLSETDITMNDGRLKLNLGFAQVGYDARIDQFALPAEFEAGFGWQLNPRLRLLADARWIDWASAADEVRIRGRNPDVPVPLQNPELTFKLKWKSQWVYAVGAEYALTDEHTIRAGYNYGGNPVPDEYLVPLFPGHVETRYCE